MNACSPIKRLVQKTALAAAIGLTLATAALAQDKPVVKILVGFPPGVGTDNLARMYGEALGEAIGA
jgi:tripartite-type tricarboxylate transporter receptor subunit TctC